jgi:hypothetical protein
MLVNTRINRRIHIPPCRLLMRHLSKIASSSIYSSLWSLLHYNLYSFIATIWLNAVAYKIQWPTKYSGLQNTVAYKIQWPINTVAYKTLWPINTVAYKHSNYLRILIYSMSQSALFNSAYNGDLTILTKPYAHGDNGTASWYSSKGGSSKNGSYKGGMRNRRLSHRRSVTQKNFRRCRTTCKINHAHARRMRHRRCTRKCAPKH